MNISRKVTKHLRRIKKDKFKVLHIYKQTPLQKSWQKSVRITKFWIFQYAQKSAALGRIIVIFSCQLQTLHLENVWFDFCFSFSDFCFDWEVKRSFEKTHFPFVRMCARSNITCARSPGICFSDFCLVLELKKDFEKTHFPLWKCLDIKTAFWPTFVITKSVSLTFVLI